MKLTRTLSLIAVLVLVVIAGSPLQAQDRSEGVVPRFEEGLCPFPAIITDIEITCGNLIVKQNRSDPNSMTTSIALAILHSRSETPRPDPVVYLEGGPGGGTLSDTEFWVDSPILDSRDLILFDQRGTGYSEPTLLCPEYDEEPEEYLESDEAYEEFYANQMAICQERHTEDGVDFDAYNSAESAIDLDEMREVLGYEEWNLYGISYGTRLALTAMRDQPEGIRSVILDSTFPLPANFYEDGPASAARVFEELLAGCANDPECSEAYPDLENHFYALLEGIEKDYINVRVDNPYTGTDGEWMLIDDETFLTILYDALYSSALLPFLPMIIEESYQGRTGFIQTLAELYLDQQYNDDFSLGMYYAVQCYEELPFNSRSDAERVSESHPDYAFMADSYSFSICEAWESTAPSSIENEAVSSDIPTLILGGQYDPVTPPQWGRDAGATLSNSIFYLVPGQAHGASFTDCTVGVMTDFLDDPTREPDGTCIEAMPGPDFVIGLASIPHLYDFAVRLFDFNLLLYATLIGLFLALSVTFSARPLKWKSEIKIGLDEEFGLSSDPPGWLRFTALLMPALAALNIFIMLYLIVGIVGIVVTVNSNEFILLFGLPAWGKPLIALSYASAIGTFTMMLMTFYFTQDTYPNQRSRVHFYLLLVASLGFVGWLYSLNLLQ